MGDLQCPATFILVSSADPAVRAAAERDAAATGAGLASLTGVVDGAGLRRRLDELSDLHRGETLLVVAPADMIRDALGGDEAPDDRTVVAIDSSGWTLLRRAP